MKKIPFVNIAGQHASIKNEIMDAVSKCLDNGNFILGEDVAIFERNIADYCGSKFAVAVNSGFDALFLALKALNIGPGDEVITAPNSFLATASVIVAAGAMPVFVDITNDLNIDVNLIEKKITKKTKAIMPVHFTGKPASMNLICSLAEKYNLKIIEDCAQAIGAEYYGKKVGIFGDAGCFSLHPLKTLNACGDGGVIVTNNEKILRTVTQLRNIGLKNRNESDIWGYNSRLDTIHAAILNVKLRHLEEWTKSRINNAHFYLESLKGIVEIPPERDYERNVYHTFIIQVDRREDLINYLEDKGVESKVHYPIPIHLQVAARSLGYRTGDFPVTERAANRILSLPVYDGLKIEQLKHVSDSIISFYKN